MSQISYIKRTAAAVSALALMLSAAGCGEDTMYSASFNGTDIPAGIYIYGLFSSYYEAQSHMTETDTDVFAITVEDKNAADWMTDKAKDSVREYAAVEQKFSEYGLSLSSDEISNTKANVDAIWEYYGSIYENYGISSASVVKVYENGLKADKLFDVVYGEGGERYVSDDEIKAYLKENYALINYIDMKLVDGDENLLKSDGKAERMAMAKEYVERIKNGEDFDSVALEYHNYFISLPKTETAAGDENSEILTDDTDAVHKEIFTDTDEVSESSEEVSETSDEVSETSDEYSQAEAVPSDASAEGEEEDSGVWADEADIAAEPEEDTGDADIEGADALDFGDLSDHVEEYSLDDFTSNRKVVKIDSKVPDETVEQKVFNEMSDGDIVIIEEDEHYYIVQKYDILEDESYYASAKDSLLHEMKDEDYKELTKSWTDSVSVTFNDKAIKRYLPTKFAEDKN